MDKEQIKTLLAKYNDGIANDYEVSLIETWYLNYNKEKNIDLSPDEIEVDVNEIFQSLPEVYKPVRLWPRIAIAASVLIVLSLGFYLAIHKKQDHQLARLYKNDITPGSNKAILTLANGVQIILTGTKNGKVTDHINKTVEGLLAYSKAPAEVGFNTLTTPIGGQYEVNLSDGTKVWLNAASSLKYPASFASLKERRVELTGEAYFEVVHNATIPFKVVTGKQITEDIGTHFNINAYDAAIKTTLLEGSVKVNESQTLLPGQQAVFNNDELKIGQGDTEEAIAWKNGYFRFNNETIRDIMPKLARWYNIDVVYDGSISSIGFYGTISRSKDISEVLTMLEQTQGVHFKIEGRRVTVLE